MAQTFRQRIAQAEAMARADMLRFQPEVILHISWLCFLGESSLLVSASLTLPFPQSGLTLSSDGILGPLNSDLPAEGLDLSDVPPAEDEES